MSGVELSAVLPTFNESENIIPLIERIEASLAGVPHEVIVVDDDSPDGTSAVVARFAERHPAVKIHRRIGKKGLTTAIQDGIDLATGDAVLWMDCDLSMPPEAIPALYAALAHADVAIGSRYVPGGADARDDVPLHRLSSKLLNGYLKLLLGSEVTDYTTGFVCARRRVLDDIRLRGDHGEYCIDFLHRARKRGFAIVELPYRNTPRVHGESKTATSALGLLTTGWKYVTASLRLRLELGR